MEKWKIPTKFNKTGKRVLKGPLDDKVVCAPANRIYKQARHNTDAEFRRNVKKTDEAYIEKMMEFVASYVASDSASKEDRYKIARFLAEGRLIQFSRWSEELGYIPGLSEVEQEAWQKMLDGNKKLEEEKEGALHDARSKWYAMKKELWREVNEYIHRECHPEDGKRIESEKGENRDFSILKEEAGELKESKKLEELQDRMHRLREL